MSGEIAAAWSRTMVGNDTDIVSFVDELLAMLLRTDWVTGQVHAGKEIEIATASESVRLSADGASAKLRMACARLAVVFRSESRDPPSIYGGRFTGRMPVGDITIDVKLDLKNTTSDVSFRLERVKV